MSLKDETLERAARARRHAMRARADRPTERRNSENASGPARLLARASLSLRESRSSSSGSGWDFSGIASATNVNYQMYDFFGPYDEQVVGGAFQATLAQSDLDCPLVLGHDSMRRIARTTNGSLKLAETDEGLQCDAPGLDPSDADVAYIAPKIRSGLIDEMSFRFIIVRGEWSPDFTQFNILETDINRGDVSIVGYGANPTTSVQLRSIAQKLQVGRALDAQDVNVLTQALGWLGAIDSITDQAQESLSAYLKVPNPDADDVDDANELSQHTLAELRAEIRELRAHIKGAPPAVRDAPVAAGLTFKELLAL